MRGFRTSEKRHRREEEDAFWREAAYQLPTLKAVAQGSNRKNAESGLSQALLTWGGLRAFQLGSEIWIYNSVWLS
jgi:hypothetical protein